MPLLGMSPQLACPKGAMVSTGAFLVHFGAFWCILVPLVRLLYEIMEGQPPYYSAWASGQ